MLPDVLGEFLKISESTPVFPDPEKGYLLHELSSELPVVWDGKSNFNLLIVLLSNFGIIISLTYRCLMEQSTESTNMHLSTLPSDQWAKCLFISQHEPYIFVPTDEEINNKRYQHILFWFLNESHCCMLLRCTQVFG